MQCLQAYDCICKLHVAVAQHSLTQAKFAAEMLNSRLSPFATHACPLVHMGHLVSHARVDDDVTILFPFIRVHI